MRTIPQIICDEKVGWQAATRKQAEEIAAEPISDIESACFNISTARNDAEYAACMVAAENLPEALVWIGNAINQLEAARGKIQRHQTNTPSDL